MLRVGNPHMCFRNKGSFTPLSGRPAVCWRACPLSLCGTTSPGWRRVKLGKIDGSFAYAFPVPTKVISLLCCSAERAHLLTPRLLLHPMFSELSARYILGGVDPFDSLFYCSGGDIERAQQSLHSRGKV